MKNCTCYVSSFEDVQKPTDDFLRVRLCFIYLWPTVWNVTWSHYSIDAQKGFRYTAKLFCDPLCVIHIGNQTMVRCRVPTTYITIFFCWTTPCCVLNICILKCIILNVRLWYWFILWMYFELFENYWILFLFIVIRLTSYCSLCLNKVLLE